MSGVLLARPWDPAKQDPTGWWMSEKIDGVRAVWDGQKFRSRNMNDFYAPKAFTAMLPRMPLDGELTVGRGGFQDTVSIVRSHADKGWRRVKYLVFDLYGNARDPFETRQRLLAAIVRDARAPNLERLEQIRCEGAPHLLAYVDRVLRAGGEGAMLRQPGSRYEPRRSSTLLKVKRFGDVDARVVGYVAGKGKHVGRLGALACSATLRGKKVTFRVGTGLSDRERERPPRIGSRVTVRFQELTRDGIPRFPIYITERNYE